MSTLVSMTSTVGELQNGSLYRVRSKTAKTLIKNSQATKSNLKKSASATVGKG